jgi:TPR repeat protein
MAARFANWIAIAVGGAGGTLAALLGSTSAPPPVSGQNMPLRPVNEIAARAQAATAAVSAAPAMTAALVESAVASGDAAPPASTPPSTASAAPTHSSAPAAPASSADTAELPTTPESLLHAEMHCDQGKSEFCIIAARSYESGSAGQTDPDKAQKYRRIALTMWISHCDHNSAAACVTLSKMYRAGEGVPQSDRNADALVARARELCRYTDVPVCHDSPVTP